MTSEITIMGRKIGPGHPCFIIAEAGVNHNGVLDTALKMIDAASEAGVDSVKFQTFKTDSVITKQAEKADYQKAATGNGTQYDMVKRLELTHEDFETLFRYAREKNIIILSSPFDMESTDLLDKLGISAYKIASGEITNLPLLKHIASKDKTMILSTGMASLDEISKALAALDESGKGEVAILHCITSYPAEMSSLNLKMLETLSSFGRPVGYSDHSLGILAPVAAVALGACIIEKHFTLDSEMEGPDHKASLEPQELGEMVRSIRQIESALGDGNPVRTPEEEKIKLLVRRSIVAQQDINEGQEITSEMLNVKRPGTGLPPMMLQSVIGRKATRFISKDEQIKEGDYK